MEIIRSGDSVHEIDSDLIVVPVFKGETADSGVLATLDRLTEGWVRSALASGEASGERDKFALLHWRAGALARRVALFGVGDLDGSNLLALQRAGGSILLTFTSAAVKSIGFVLRGSIDSASAARAIVEGAVLSQLDYSIYRPNGPPRPKCERFIIASERSVDGLEGAIETARILADATNFARSMGNEPANVMTPVEMARRSKEMAEREALEFEELDEDEMKRLGMGALLAVSRGSAEPARLIVLGYKPREAASSGMIALVGKGLTFDSGGISIKPAEEMDEMKFDMCGGAAVAGAMMAIARLKPKVGVLGLIASSENLPSGRAYKPGDVLRSYSGKTIEVINTDAEGRLILADAISYAIGRGATHIVDTATLTGACVVALGEVRAAVMGNNPGLVADLIKAGAECGERLWEMPLDREYGELIRSDIADMKNSGGRIASAITAAMFLKQFAGSVPWAHIDIAGTAWLTKAKPYMAKGATGFGVRTLTGFVLNRAAGRSA